MNFQINESSKLLPEVVSIAIDAGRVIMEIYERADSLQVEYKQGGSPLTEADSLAHELIVKRLSLLEHQLPVLSEESDQCDSRNRLNWVSYWLVDPLDGTKEFIKRNGEFTVNIALVEDGKPILGVVYAPALDVCYFAAQGGAAYKQEAGKAAVAIKVQSVQAGQPIIVVASRSHSDARTDALLERLGEHRCLSMGSSLKLCLVAEGKAHFYPRLGPTMEWDTPAAHAIVNAAGGVVQDIDGNELHYNKPDLHNPEFFVRAGVDRHLEQNIKAVHE